MKKESCFILIYQLVDIFGKVNKAGAPKSALLIAAFGIIPFLAIEQIQQGGLSKLIDMLVSIFLYVYLFCSLAYIKLVNRWYKEKNKRLKAKILAQFSIIFCIFTLSQDIVSSLIVLTIFIAIGFPIFWKYKNTIKSVISGE